jgi:hypothetical protein
MNWVGGKHVRRSIEKWCAELVRDGLVREARAGRNASADVYFNDGTEQRYSFDVREMQTRGVKALKDWQSGIRRAIQQGATGGGRVQQVGQQRGLWIRYGVQQYGGPMMWHMETYEYGGRGDHIGNGIYRIDLLSDSPAWSRIDSVDSWSEPHNAHIRAYRTARQLRAEERAKDLFRMVAGQEAYERLSTGGMDIVGSMGTKYRLFPWHSFCVRRESDNAALCAIVDGVPLWDHLLGIKLLIEHDEPRFLSVANVVLDPARAAPPPTIDQFAGWYQQAHMRVATLPINMRINTAPQWDTIQNVQETMGGTV